MTPTERFYGDFTQGKLTIEELVYLSVDRSTIRSYHIPYFQPISLFRTWALSFLNADRTEEPLSLLFQISTQEDFEIFHSKTIESLKAFWVDEFRELEIVNIKDHQAYKLVDLLIKFLPICKFPSPNGNDELTEETREAIFEWGHCPLDSYSLRGQMNEINRVLRSLGHTKLVKSNSTMNFVNRKNYQVIQQTIRNIPKLMGRVPLGYDLHALADSKEQKVRNRFEELISSLMSGSKTLAKSGVALKPIEILKADLLPRWQALDNEIDFPKAMKIIEALRG